MAVFIKRVTGYSGRGNSGRGNSGRGNSGRGNSGRDHVPQTVRGSGYSSPRSNASVIITQPTTRPKPVSSDYPDDKGYMERVNWKPRNFRDWYVNYSNPFYATAHVLDDKIRTGLKNARVNKNSAFGIRDVFKNFKDLISSLRSSSSSGSGHGSGSGLSSGSSEIPASVPDYLNADLARHYGMDASTAYMEALANTSHQREVKDLISAGLNPVLSTRYGGSSGVSGATVYASPVDEGSLGSTSARSVSSSSVIADLASGIVGLATGSSARSNATRSIVNALGNVVENIVQTRD